MRPRASALAGLAVLVAVGACGPGRPSGPPAPAPGAEVAAEGAGALSVDIVYPVDSQLVSARDSTFIFGNVSDPDARLFVGGQPVRVHPNGAFLGWVPVPREPGDTSALFVVTASSDGGSATALRWVRVPRLPPELAGDSLLVDTARITPRGTVWTLPGEPLRASVRATAGADVWVEWPTGERFRLAERSAVERAVRGANGVVPSEGASHYVGDVPARSPLGRGTVEPARVPPPPPPPPPAPPETALVAEVPDPAAGPIRWDSVPIVESQTDAQDARAGTPPRSTRCRARSWCSRAEATLYGTGCRSISGCSSLPGSPSSRSPIRRARRGPTGSSTAVRLRTAPTCGSSTTATGFPSPAARTPGCGSSWRPISSRGSTSPSSARCPRERPRRAPA